MKITLINGWKTWWRQWSTWLTVAAGFIFNLDLVSSILYAWNIIPEDLRSSIPTDWQRSIGTFILIIGFVAKYIRQRKLHEEVNQAVEA